MSRHRTCRGASVVFVLCCMLVVFLCPSTALSSKVCKRGSAAELLLHCAGEKYPDKREYSITGNHPNVRAVTIFESKRKWYGDRIQKDLYRIEECELSLKVRRELDVEDGWFTYLTPGLVKSEPLGILHCKKDLENKENLSEAIECRYYMFKKGQKLPELTANPLKKELTHRLGRIAYNEKIGTEQSQFKKAIIVSYTDNELVTSTGASTRTAEDKFIVNTVYSLLRALKVREDLIKKDQHFETHTFFLSNLFSSSVSQTLEARKKERKTEIYFYDGEFFGQALVRKASMFLKEKITPSMITTLKQLRKNADSSDYDQVKKIKLTKCQFDTAYTILKKIKAAPSPKSLEELFSKEELSRLYMESRGGQLRAQGTSSAGRVGVY